MRSAGTPIEMVSEVGGGTMPLLAQARPPAAAAPRATPPVEVEGEIEVFVEDYPTHANVRHFIKSNGRRRELRFTGDPPGVLTGDRVRVRGVLQPDDTIQLSSDPTNIQTITPAQQATLGPQSTIVILVNFQSTPVQPYTVSQAQTVMTQVSDHYTGLVRTNRPS